MKDEEKVKLVRAGNEHFNKGNISEAIRLFVKAGYRDGIMRVADYYYFDKKQPLIAFKFYKMINRKDRVDEIFARMMFALGKWLRSKPDREKTEEANSQDAEIEVKIHPKLKILAEEIIRDNQKEK